MIGVDTNILLRVLLQDDPEQNAEINAALIRARDAGETLYIGPVAFVETIWTLRRRVPMEELTSAVSALIATPPFRIFDEKVATGALEMFSGGKAGFSDCIIAAMNDAAGCARTLTFDRGALSLTHFMRPHAYGAAE
jgi:predicted nucleic-acid-binding protein